MEVPVTTPDHPTTQARRLAPLSPPYEEWAERLLAKWMPPGTQLDPLMLFRVLIVHRDLAERLFPMASGLLAKGLLPDRDREVLISRTTARAGAEYEWGVHAVFFGSKVGLDDTTLGALATEPAASPVFDAPTRLLVTAADELHEQAGLSEHTWDQLAVAYEPAQVLELLALCGWYRTLSTVINSVGLPLEPWAARFPHHQQHGR
jgi:4-carboxymuconolactone decarboxylase